jgi:ribosome-associated protein
MAVKTLDSFKLSREIVNLIADKKGEDIVLLDIREQTIIADYFIICSGSSERQLKAIVDGIDEEIKKEHQIDPRSIEGDAKTGWVLIDYVDVVIHAFAPEIRHYYNLEGFWAENGASVMLKMQ